MPEPRWGKPSKQFGNSLEKKLIAGMEENGRFSSPAYDDHEPELSGRSKLVSDEDPEVRGLVEAFFRQTMHNDVLIEENNELSLLIEGRDKVIADFVAADHKLLDRMFYRGVAGGIVCCLLFAIGLYWLPR